MQVDFKLASGNFCPGTSFSAMLSCWHDVSKKTSHTCTPLNNINNRMARSKMIDAVTDDDGRVTEAEEWGQTACSL